MINLLKASFISFDKYRFRCMIKYQEKIISAYVSSSMSIKKHLQNSSLTNIPCLIYNNKRGGFTLFALLLNDQYIIVDLKIVNHLFGQYLNSSSLIYEKNIDGYRCDIYDYDKREIYEIKTIMSDLITVNYPDHGTCRYKNQLLKMDTIHQYKKNIVFLLLNNTINEIIFDEGLTELMKYNNIKFYYCFLNEKVQLFIHEAKIKNNLEV